MLLDAPVYCSLHCVVQYLLRSPLLPRRDEWLSVWHQRGVDAERGEPGTTGYVACTDLEEPSHVMIWERYTEPAALEAHTSRKAHAKLMDDMGSRNMTKRIVFGGLSFTDVPGVGYWGRDERVLTEKQQQRGTVRALSTLPPAFAALPPSPLPGQQR